MAKPKGHPKTGGRKKGTLNRRTLHLFEEINRLSFNPIQEFVQAFHTLSGSEKALYSIKFIEFLYPKQREVEPELIIEEKILEQEDDEAVYECLSDEELEFLLKIKSKKESYRKLLNEKQYPEKRAV